MSEQPADEHLDALERERAEDVAKAHAALAAAQDRSYWLDRWNLDLNAMMRKPGAGLIRAGLRAVRAVYRFVYDTRNETGRMAGAARGRVEAARSKLDRERADAVVAAESAPVADGRLGATPVSDALNGNVDGEDVQALAALARADVVVDALGRTGLRPAEGQRWLGVGGNADAVLRLLGAAHPGLICQTEGTGEPADAAFALVVHGSVDAVREQLARLHPELKAGAALVLGAERGESPVTPSWIAANATPDWGIALYLAGGLDGDRDLYVLERR